MNPYYCYLIIGVTLVVVIITIVKCMIRDGIIVRLKHNNEVILWERTSLPLRSASAYAQILLCASIHCWLVKLTIDLIVYQFMIYFTTLFGIRKDIFMRRYIV